MTNHPIILHPHIGEVVAVKLQVSATIFVRLQGKLSIWPNNHYQVRSETSVVAFTLSDVLTTNDYRATGHADAPFLIVLKRPNQ
jgi:hypothetical protein